MYSSSISPVSVQIWKQFGKFGNVWTKLENITSFGKTVKEANKSALSAVNMINWDGSYYRNDIGWRAIKREENG